MKIKSERGVTGVDLATGLIIFLIGTAAVLNLYVQIYKTTTTLKINEAILGYVTEVFEEIDLENYDDITDTRVDEIILAANIPSQYTITKTITKYQDKVREANGSNIDDNVKRISLNIAYTIDDTTRNFTISKVKVREKEVS